MNSTISMIGKLNYSYACLRGPNQVSSRAKKLAQAVAHGYGLIVYPSADEYLHFADETGQAYVFGQLNRGAGFTSR